MKILSLVMIMMLFFAGSLFAQVGISTDGGNHDGLAMLDVKSSDKGILIPRIDYNSKPASPATGLPSKS